MAARPARPARRIGRRRGDGLAATRWIDRIGWASSTFKIALTQEQIKASPAYEDAMPIARDYEKRLHDAYDRQGYWA